MDNMVHINVKRELWLILNELKKDMQFGNKSRVIEDLLKIRKEFLKMSGRVAYLKIMEDENIKIDDFIETFKRIEENMVEINNNQNLIWNEIQKSKQKPTQD